MFLYGRVRFFGQMAFLFKEVRICYLFGQNRIYLEGFVQTNLTGFFLFGHKYLFIQMYYIFVQKNYRSVQTQ